MWNIIGWIFIFIIPTTAIVGISLLAIFVKPVAAYFRMYTFGDVLMLAIVGLIPMLNALVFYAVLFIEINDGDKPDWWYLPSTKK